MCKLTLLLASCEGAVTRVWQHASEQEAYMHAAANMVESIESSSYELSSPVSRQVGLRDLPYADLVVEYAKCVPDGMAYTVVDCPTGITVDNLLSVGMVTTDPPSAVPALENVRIHADARAITGDTTVGDLYRDEYSGFLQISIEGDCEPVAHVEVYTAESIVERNRAFATARMLAAAPALYNALSMAVFMLRQHGETHRLGLLALKRAYDPADVCDTDQEHLKKMSKVRKVAQPHTWYRMGIYDVYDTGAGVLVNPDRQAITFIPVHKLEMNGKGEVRITPR